MTMQYLELYSGHMNKLEGKYVNIGKSVFLF